MNAIKTPKAIISAEYAVITLVSKYTLTIKQLSNFLDYKAKNRAFYRRFIRLTPFIHTRADKRKTYKEYVKCKFVQKADGDVSRLKKTKKLQDKVTLNTLYFVQNLVSDNKEYNKFGEALIENILTHHFWKVFYENKAQRSSEPHVNMILEKDLFELLKSKLSKSCTIDI